MALLFRTQKVDLRVFVRIVQYFDRPVHFKDSEMPKTTFLRPKRAKNVFGNQK